MTLCRLKSRTENALIQCIIVVFVIFWELLHKIYTAVLIFIPDMSIVLQISLLLASRNSTLKIRHKHRECHRLGHGSVVMQKQFSTPQPKALESVANSL